MGIDILTGKRIDLDILEYIPDIKGNPQAMEVIAELAAKLPEMEIDGRMSEEFEAKAHSATVSVTSVSACSGNRLSFVSFWFSSLEMLASCRNLETDTAGAYARYPRNRRQYPYTGNGGV